MENFPAICSEETKLGLTSAFDGKATVRKGGFTLRSDDGTQQGVFEGELTHGGRKAEGIFRFSGFVSVDGQPQGCHSGYGSKVAKLRWTAAK